MAGCGTIASVVDPVSLELFCMTRLEGNSLLDLTRGSQ